MPQISESILPIFSIILLGYFLKQRRIAGPAFAKTANQIVFYVAIPAMLFSSISQAPFRENFHLTAVVCLLMVLAFQLLLSIFAMRLLIVPAAQRGTFLQSSFHGNLGYMAYAIAYYAFGQEVLARTAILSSFLMVAQNLMAVWVLVAFRSTGEGRSERQRGVFLKSIYQNPIILTVIVSMLYSATGLRTPTAVQRGLQILSGMSLPTALLLIGASLSFSAMRKRMKEIIGIGLLKLICFPLIGLIIMKLAQVPEFFIMSGVILLASPPATVTYIMASELGGDPELAASSISILTLASAFSYSLLLFLVDPAMR